MVTIEVNGIAITAETVKAANKMARAEEKKQQQAANEQQDNRDRASDMAYANLGRIAVLVERNSKALALDTPDNYSQSNRDDAGISLRISTRDQPGLLPLYDGDTVHGLLVNPAGLVYAYLIARHGDAQAWWAVGAVNGAVACVSVPTALTYQLNRAYHNDCLYDAECVHLAA